MTFILMGVQSKLRIGDSYEIINPESQSYYATDECHKTDCQRIHFNKVSLHNIVALRSFTATASMNLDLTHSRFQ
jgi:hypothetical protein